MTIPPNKESQGPYPDVRGAFTLTLLAMLAAAFTGVAFMDFGLIAAVGIGQAIGVGAVATMGAKRVAEPQAERLGLRALDLKHIPVILCLAPAVLLVSELDNIAADWSGATASEQAETLDESETPEAFDVPESPEPVDRELEDGSVDDILEANRKTEAEVSLTSRLVNPDDPWSLLSAFVVMVGISPVVEEFLFRGVIQQGLVQRMGMLRGVSMVALLWTLLRPAPIAGFARFLAAAIASFGLGWALGIVRIASNSILGSILLAASWATIGLASLALEGRMELPGMNIESTHLPWTVTIASLLMVGWAGWAVYLEADRRFHSTDAEAISAESGLDDEDRN